jgi:hypothetical protein
MTVQAVNILHILLVLFEYGAPFITGIALVLPYIIVTANAYTGFNLTGVLHRIAKSPICRNGGDNIYAWALLVFMGTHPTICSLSARLINYEGDFPPLPLFYIQNMFATFIGGIGTIITATPIVITLALLYPSRNVTGTNKTLKESATILNT